ncbi:glycoside hydrolase family 25 protein [Actinokineospora sp. PR83]|uniref:glycoside hydrolase family 25 protein n=1 Tax=Actinokineospora sp. PR83 TaxID=2884908 RepID=UPI001F48CFAA|nr:glycoside hydrolase family 25 protein [Actinokineospora sp. PR83]MCG8916955.1 glycoside hydrolase family 25 protein [Actinokineospora sp. PR83]
MFGIDIYGRYQTVTDWWAVRGAGVRFAWVKASDGGGPALVRADALVAGARSVGIAVGLYHFAQKSPGPEVQAGVLAGEVSRLGARGVVPALDMEDNAGAGLRWSVAEAREYGTRFLHRLRELGYDRTAIYSSVGQLGQWRPEGWGVPELVIWAARYGSNNGSNQGLGGYSGRVDVHQYTSVGRVPGISGSVDLNNGLTDPTEEGFLSALSDIEQRTLYNRVMGFLRQRWYLRGEDGSIAMVPEGTPGAIPAAALDTLDGNHLVGLLGEEEAAVVDALRLLSSGRGTVADLAAAIAPVLPEGTDPDDFATALRVRLAPPSGSEGGAE